jgi:hypothetical protein
VLEFSDTESGMMVLDAFSADGYYTELLARVVGPAGRVTAYDNPPDAKYAEKHIAARYAGGRLPNVRQVTSTIEELDVAPASLDAVIFVMSYHDLYWRPADGSWPPQAGMRPRSWTSCTGSTRRWSRPTSRRPGSRWTVRATCSGFLQERCRMPAQVISDEGLDEVVAVVVSGVHAQLERLA